MRPRLSTAVAQEQTECLKHLLGTTAQQFSALNISSLARVSLVTPRIAEDLRVVEADVLPSASSAWRSGYISFIMWTVEGWPLLDALG